MKNLICLFCIKSPYCQTGTSVKIKPDCTLPAQYERNSISCSIDKTGGRRGGEGRGEEG
jgi:hypothetical protein